MDEREHTDAAISGLRRTGTILFGAIMFMVLAHGVLVHFVLEKQNTAATLSREIGEQRVALTLMGRNARNIVLAQKTGQIDPRIVMANVSSIKTLHATILARDLRIEALISKISGLFFSRQEIVRTQENYHGIFDNFMDRSLSLANQVEGGNSPVFGLLTLPDLAIAPGGALMSSLAELDRVFAIESERIHRISSNVNKVSVAVILLLIAAIVLAIFRPLAIRAQREFRNVQRMNSVRTRYFYQMSHELRTPLNAIIGFGGMLKFSMDKQKAKSGDTEKVDIILSAGNDLAEKIENIILLAELHSGQYENTVTHVSLLHKIKSLLAQFDSPKVQGLLVTPADVSEIIVRCDSEAFDAMFRHLIRNAIAHAEAACRIRVSLDDETVTVAIEDDGPGIDMSQLERILEPFHTTENSEFETDSGLGIGLAVVKILADKNDVALDFTNLEPAGTSASLTFEAVENIRMRAMPNRETERVSDSAKGREKALAGARLAYAIVFGLLLGGAPFNPLKAQESVPLEVQHFWFTTSEATALRVIKDAYRERGGNWIDFTMQNAAESRSMAIQRIAEGIPPSAVQWHAGREIRELEKSGVIVDLTDIAEEAHWPEVLLPEVMKHIRNKTRIFSLPVGIHAENWAWYNKHLLDRYGGLVPDNWSDLLRILALADADGVTGIAVGTESWQRALLFNSILIGEGGADVYMRLHRDGDLDALDTPEFAAALQIFIELRQYGPKFGDVVRWQDATAMIGSATAIVQFMGDWVLAELQSNGYTVDQDFICALSTGKVRRHLSVVDAFVFPARGRYRLEDERRLFADVVLDRHVQLVFSQAKGTIPVRADLAQSILDPCIRKSYELFATAGSSLPSAVIIGNERATAALNKVASDVWDNPGLDSAMALQVFRSVLQFVQTARN